MAADWEEVKRLAADFQRAQLSSTTQKLSERNCVEIVKKLIELKLIDVIFTSDGKEYLTPQRLLKEIKDELFVHGGRINLVELAQLIGVDFSHIEAKASEFAKSEQDVRIILGQLITSDYLDNISEEINEKLQQTGHITIGELTKLYDLPGYFLEEVVYERVGTIIQAQPDSSDARAFFTQSFISNHKARVQGILSAITRPVPLATLINHFQIPEKLFYNVAEELTKSGRISGTLTAGRADKALFIPDIYARSQNEWVDAFYKQNGYLEYDSLSRLGVHDPKAYVRKRFKEEQLTFLSSCCAGKAIVGQVESAVEEALSAGAWVDVMPILPSVFTAEDCQQAIRSVIKSVSKQGGVIRVFGDSIVISEAVIRNCLDSFEPEMAAKAKEDIVKKPHLFLQTASKGHFSKKDDSKGKQDKKDDRKKKNAGKSGGGTQGRETKNRTTKKKYLSAGGKAANEESGSDEEASSAATVAAARDNNGSPQQLDFLSPEDVQKRLAENAASVSLQDCPEELIAEIASEIHGPLSKKYEEVAKALFASTVAASGSSRRKQFAEFQEKIGALLAHINLFEKGLKLFADDVAAQMNRHLLRTLCSEGVNMVVNYLAYEHGASSCSDLGSELSSENRLKMIEKLPDEFKQPLKKLHTSVNSKTLEDFWTHMDGTLATGVCDVAVKKSDKKKERLVLLQRRQSLLAQLSQASEPALGLHLAALLVFQTQTRHMLHASGKFVPHIICYLQRLVPADVYATLATFQEHVIKMLTSTENAEENATEALLPQLKDCATLFKKASVSEAEA